MVSRFEVLVERSLAGVYIIQDDRFRYVNPAFAHIFGYDDPADLVDRVDVYDLIAPESRGLVRENVQRRISGIDESLRYSFTGLRRDGARIELEVHGSRASFDGRPAIFGMLLDMTESRRMQAALLEHERELEIQVKERTEELNLALEKLSLSEERYRVLFSSSKVPMLLVDPANGKLVDANEAACDYYGYGPDGLTGMFIHEINQLSDEAIDAEIADARRNNRNHFFFVHKLADGTLRDVEVHSGPLEIGGNKLLYSIIHDVTDRRLAEEHLKELNRDFITLLENTSDFIYFKDRESRFRFCSQTLARITGHDNWRDMVGKHDLEVFPPDTAKIYYEEELPIFEKGESLLNRIDPYYKEDGDNGWVSTNKWPVFDDNGRDVIGLFGISRDITAQHEAEEKLKVAASVFENANEGILITDADGNVIEVNHAFCRISGYSREEVLNRNPRFLNSGHHDEAFFNDMWEALERTGYWQGEIWNRRKDGSLFACRTSINALVGPDGKVNRYIGLHSDITDFLKHHEQVEHMAYYDTLTELPNRALLFDRMTQALAMADRTGTTLAVCFLDLDMFKPVNDKFGHKAGDLLLVEVARRLKRCVRTEDTVARLGGDEFALLLTHLPGEDDLLHLLDRVIAVTAEHFEITGSDRVSVSASLGVSLYPQSRVSGDELLRLADKVMYEAKELGRNQYRIYGAY
ncbi:MAG: PAS domain S-box protein [Candidatus Thiodiazotropha sp.]